MINWNIAGHPVNWIKIGLMAAIFVFGAEYLVQCLHPAPATSDPAQ